MKEDPDGCYYEEDPNSSSGGSSSIAKYLNGNPSAVNCVGRCLLIGAGTKKDEAAAYKLFDHVKDKCDEAMFNCGMCLYMGLGVGKDVATAKARLKCAGEKGHAHSPFMKGSFKLE